MGWFRNWLARMASGSTVSPQAESEELLKKLDEQQAVTLGLLGGEQTHAGWVLGFDDRAISFCDESKDPIAYLRHSVVWIKRPGGVGQPRPGEPPLRIKGFGQFVEYLRQNLGTVECRPIPGGAATEPIVGVIDHLDGDVLYFRDINEDVQQPVQQWVLLSGLCCVGRYRPSPTDFEKVDLPADQARAK